MFTGIIEKLGQVVAIEKENTNIHFQIRSEISKELKIDQSIAHNGVCLTVTEVKEDTHFVTAIAETLEKTALKYLKVNDVVNLERCVMANARLDGHIVQGHVDTTGTCSAITDLNGSWKFEISHPENALFQTVEKGSICINGVSLTVVDSSSTSFSVAIIPYTYENTTFKNLKVGDVVNLEFDIVGKYLSKFFNVYSLKLQK